jgi:putative ABC transport system permease protein
MNRMISWGEVRLGLRLIVKQPILSGTIVLALATGMGLATMGFTFRDALMNSSLPYRAGERTARIHALSRDGRRAEVDIERYRAFRDRGTSFEHVGLVSGRPFTLTHGPNEVESITGGLVTAGSMPWLDAVPIAGRAFIAADGEPGAERVALIRESLWRRRYSGDPALVGRSITIGGQPRTIVGIMPDTFQFPNSGELWLPFEEQWIGAAQPSTAMNVFVLAVLKPGVTFEAATVEANALSAPLPSPAAPEDVSRITVRPFTADSGQADFAMSALVFVLVMVLMVVASNVATLVFARTWSRAPELAVRTALGAARTRVVGQLFFETLLLGSIAAVMGLAGAYAALRYIKGSFEGWPFWVTLVPNPRVVAFVILLTLLVSAVAGLFPALRVTRHDLRNTLQAGRGFAFGGFGRVGGFLLVVEIALSIALLNGAVTMARAFDSFVSEIPALPKNQVVTAHMGRVTSPELRDKIVEAAAALPGVTGAGAGQLLPRLYPAPRSTAIESIGDETPRAPQAAPSFAVGNGYLEAIGARTLAGRLFTATDFNTGAAPVAVVNEPFVQKFLGGRNPIGRRLRIEQPREDGTQEPWYEIVGVVPDLGLSVGDPALTAGFYLPVRDERLTYLAIRTLADPISLTPQLRAAIARIDPDLQVEEIRTLEDAGMEESVFLSGIALALMAMGGMALVLSIVGIYALLSFMVTRRTREIGIRVALGAASWQVLRSITGGAMVYLAVGGVLGSVLGVAFVQLRSSILISIPSPGFWMPATIFLTLAIAGLTACWLPARRALGIRPSEALQAD